MFMKQKNIKFSIKAEAHRNVGQKGRQLKEECKKKIKMEPNKNNQGT